MALLGDRRVGRLYRLRRGVTLLLVAMAFAGTLVHLDRYSEQREREAAEREAAEQQDVRRPGDGVATEDVLAGGAQVVGPALGADLPTYVGARREALDGAADGSEPRVAVVSFAEYAAPADVLDILPSGSAVRFAQVRIPAEGLTPFETEVVGGDLIGSVERALDAPMSQLASEEQEARTLLESGTVEDEEFVRDLQLRIEELAAVRNLVNSGSGLIFAVVIEAPLDALQALAEDQRVRLVDLASAEIEIENSGFYGLLPEDDEVATYGSEA